MSIARQRVARCIPATTNTSIASQRRGKHAFATIDEVVFSMGATRDNIRSAVVNEKPVRRRGRIPPP
jgi:hypothetical protein